MGLIRKQGLVETNGFQKTDCLARNYLALRGYVSSSRTITCRLNACSVDHSMATGANSTPLGRLHPILASKSGPSGPIGNAANSDLRSHIEAAKRAAEIAASSTSCCQLFHCSCLSKFVFMMRGDPVYVCRSSTRADARRLKGGAPLGISSPD